MSTELGQKPDSWLEEFWTGSVAEEEAKELWRAVHPRVKEVVVQIAQEVAVTLLSEVSACESPIEQLLGMCMYHVAQTRGLADDGILILNPQQEIETPSGRFRVDFEPSCYHRGVPVSVVVECDGHDYHEKTKQQAARDKQRDRALVKTARQVLHFTGSEIWKDPWKCAKEVVDHLLRQAKRSR